MEILNPFNTSVEKAFDEIDPNWRNYQGLVICGSHTVPSPTEFKALISKIKEARVGQGRPFLGICAGHQLAYIEYCRNVKGIKDATSEEFGEGTHVVNKRKEPLVGLYKGESYWSYYNVDGEWEKPSHFYTCEYHPEYQSSIKKPHPLLVKFLKHAKMAM